MRKWSLFVLVFLFAGVTATRAQDVRYNYDSKTDFSKFKTYKWVTLDKSDHPDPLVARQIADALDAELAKKGLKKVDDDPADLYVAYQTAIGTEKQFTSYSMGWGYGPGWYRGGWYGGMGTTTTTGSTSTIQIGQLVVDMYDSANQDLIWRGTATKTLDPKAKPDKRQKNIDKAVVKLLKSYPPPAQK